MTSSTDLYVGVDIGGTITKACVVRGQDMVSSISLPTDARRPEDLVQVAVEAMRRAAGQAGHGLRDLTGVGVGIPGQVVNGIVRDTANLPIDGRGLDLAAEVTIATGLATVIENDMTVAAYGAFSQMQPSDPSLRNLVYIGLGTGVSAGLILDGRFYRGSRGLAGEFGHVPVGTGIACPCGSTGCLETVMGANAFRTAWGSEDIADLFNSASTGDTIAIRIVDRGLDHLAEAMWWLAICYDPDLFVIGGGIGINNPGIRGRLATRWAFMADESPFARLVLDPERIVVSDLEEPVGSYGAALLARADPGRMGDTPAIGGR